MAGSNEKHNASLSKSFRNIFIIEPGPGGGFYEQVEDCLQKLLLLEQKQKNKIKFLKLSIFISSTDINDYRLKAKKIKKMLEPVIQKKEPVYLIIPQKPAGDNVQITMELLTLINPVLTDEDGSKQDDRNHREAFDMMELYGAVFSTGSGSSNTTECSEECFAALESILKDNGMGMDNITRQWSYVGNITGYEEIEGKKVQNYQAFNQARSGYYDKYEWVNGYPAATGIGADVNGVFIEFHAVSQSSDVKIIPLHNPNQVDAHGYSERCLKSAGAFHEKAATPKFERGKVILYRDEIDLYVSGTAAITGEDSLAGDVEDQTMKTIENIINLTSPENLLRHGLQLQGDLPGFSSIRVYIKHPGDYEKVRDICFGHFGNTPVTYLLADICRDELLVEIEARLFALIPE